MNEKLVVLLRIDRDSATHTNHPRHLHPPLDLKYIQAAIEKDTGSHVTLIDGWLHAWSPSQLTENTLSLKPSIVVIKASTWCIDVAVSVGKALRCAGVVTIAVGQSVSHVSQVNHSGWNEAFDIPVLGEPEQEVPLLIKQLIEGELPAKLASHCLIRLEKADQFLVEEPDRLATPCFDPKEFLDYAFPFPIPGKVVNKWGYVLSAWGCSYQCDFCSQVVRKTAGFKLRTRHPVKIVDEISSLLQAGAEAICFEDDTLFCNRTHFLQICEEIINRDLRFPWIAHARPNELDEERVSAAAKAGATLLKIGVESGSPDIIKTIGKATSGEEWLEKVKKCFLLLHQHGIGSIALFMIGMPDETYHDVDKSIALAQNLGPDYIQVQIFCAYPDSKYFSKMRLKKDLPVSEENQYHYILPNWSPSKIPPNELPRLQALFYRRFYLRPQNILHHIKRFWRFYTTPQILLQRIMPMTAKLVLLFFARLVRDEKSD